MLCPTPSPSSTRWNVPLIQGHRRTRLTVSIFLDMRYKSPQAVGLGSSLAAPEGSP